MPYWRLFYHLVWATRERAPLIDEVVARVVERSIRASCDEPGIRLHALGMMPDHVHVAVSLPPRIALAMFVGQMKGRATHEVNGSDRRPGRAPFAWQNEYGALSFGERALPDVVAYVRNQREHHGANRPWTPLEQTADDSS